MSRRFSIDYVCVQRPVPTLALFPHDNVDDEKER
jgi:hypothetical protein